MAEIQTPDIPSLSSQTPTEVRRAFDAIKGWFRSIKQGGGAVTADQLTEVVASVLPPGMTDYSTPQRLEDFAATGAFRTIIITWNPLSTNYRSFNYVEIWRNTVDDLGTAEKVGTTRANLFSDAPPVASLSVTYYYWGRAINKGGVVGPFNATAGTAASTANDPGYVLDILSESLDAVDPAMTAPDIVFTADRFAIRRLTDAPGAAKYPFVVDATYGVVMDVALVRDLTSTNIRAGGIAADSIDVTELRSEILSAGSITADMYNELRQTFTCTGGDSLDENNPFYLPFKVPSETTQIVSVRVSLKIMPWRSYVKNIPAGGGSTSSTNLTITPTSSDGGSGYYATTGSATPYTATGNVKESNVGVVSITATDFTSTESSPTHNHDLSYGKTLAYLPSHTHYLDSSAFSGHTHSLNIPNHTHTITIGGHNHTIPDHNHSLTQGIYQENTGALVYIAADNGGGYGVDIGPYYTAATDVDITEMISGVGWKEIKISATDRCRVFAIIECKVDISA